MLPVFLRGSPQWAARSGSALSSLYRCRCPWAYGHPSPGFCDLGYAARSHRAGSGDPGPAGQSPPAHKRI